MRVTIEKLRTWVVVLGVLLVVALIGFFGYARYRMRQFAHDLPQKLGGEIQQSTNDFTYSQSHLGRTLFVLHAAKAVQYKGGGRAVLHDVSIVMYGKDGAPTDRISGSQFEYDPAAKIARADGAVDIELTDPASLAASLPRTLQGPAPANAGHPQASRPEPVHKPSNRPSIHVKTSGLTFNEKTQVATTDQALTFEQGEASGSARGATYDSAMGTLALANDVVLNTVIDTEAVTVKARSASLNRDAHQLYLIQQATDYQGNHGASDQATVFFRADGKADYITAEGNLHLSTPEGGSLQAANGRAQLSATGALQQIKLDGGLLLTSHDALHSLHVNSTSGVISFAPAAGTSSIAVRASHVQLIGAVSIVDQQLALPGDEHGSETRESRAGQMDIDLKPDALGHAQPQKVVAREDAIFVTHTIHANAPQQITRLKGDQIFAGLLDGHNLSSVRANGNTSLEQSTPGGLSQTSSADALNISFVPGTSAATSGAKAGRRRAAGAKETTRPPGSASGKQGSEIDTALLQGKAVLVQQQPSATPGAPPAKTTASADRIMYNGALSVIHLEGGSPRILQDGSELAASIIDFNRVNGDASATGGIKATYGGKPRDGAHAAAADATHVVAEHATLNHAQDETTFYGTPQADARVWQGPSSITAPVIVLSRTRQLLTASGAAGSVKAAFLESPRPAKQAGPPAAAQPPSVVQTTSSGLAYSGGERKVTLSGGVAARNHDGMLHASSVELYLNQASVPAGKVGGSSGTAGPGGQVERLIAQKSVQFEQGSRTGTGDKLVYTAEDGRFVLTGTSSAPPRITDPASGTITGSSLIFNNRDDSVVVSHGQSPTITDTHTKSDAHAKHP